MKKMKLKRVRGNSGRATCRLPVTAMHLIRSAGSDRVRRKSNRQGSNSVRPTLSRRTRHRGWGRNRRILKVLLEMTNFCERSLTRQVKVSTKVKGLSRNCRWEADSTRLYRPAAEEVRVWRVVRHFAGAETRTASRAVRSLGQTRKAETLWISSQFMESEQTTRLEARRT